MSKKKVLSQIVKENDIHNIAPADYRQLAKEIRAKLVRSVSRTGGHLASNLGAVELTMALHLCLHFPEDKLIWDVGHQSYVHKILTGRGDAFSTLRQMGGLSGFPKVKENPSDTFNTGHSSTSISVAQGFAKARDLRGGDEKVVAVIGDGALSGGMAFEALNNAAALKTNMVIVLNDNKMSIAPNVGGMSTYLGKIRANRKYRDLKMNVENSLDKIPNVGHPLARQIKRAKDSIKHLFIPGMLFEDMGLIYIGPVNGHNVNEMVTAFETAFSITNQPVLVHVLTQKGKGYKPAEQNPSAFHGVGTFDVKDGTILKTSEVTYTNIFSDWLLSRGEQCNELVSVCAAMPDGTGTAAFAKTFPSRAFDVGIAEEHAVTFAAGLAAGGMRPVVSLYSTFLQRAYDQMIHDVCLGSLPVIFTVDRSGIVGNDGETHQGIFDLTFLSSVPNMSVMAPKNRWELEKMLQFAISYDGPIAIRYPRGEAYRGLKEFLAPVEYGVSEMLYEERGTALLAVGSMVSTAEHIREKLKSAGQPCTLVNGRFVKPMDTDVIDHLAGTHHTIVTLEENVLRGGYGERVTDYVQKHYPQIKVVNIALPDAYVEHGNVSVLRNELGIDSDSILAQLKREGVLETDAEA